MNKIIQLKDPNNDLLFPIGFNVGGVKCDLLWTNSAKDTSFVGQTVSLDLSSYDWLIFEMNGYVNTSDIFSVIANKDTTFIFGYRSNQYLISRKLTISNSGIVFAGGYSVNNSDNAACIPYKIYGIKLAYYCPTNAPDLQYEEV